MVKSISKKEWRFFLIISLFLVAATNFYPIYGFINTPKGYEYNGVSSQLPADVFVYYSYINQVKEGALTFRNFFTPEISSTGLFNIVWLSVGGFAKFFGTGEIFAYHFTRIIFSPFFLLTIFLFVCSFFKNTKERFVAFLLTLSSGIGGLAAPFLPPSSYLLHGRGYKLPIDLWPITHGYVITTLGQSPHFVLSWTFMLWVLLLGFFAFKEKSFKYSVASGVVGLVYFNFHPYYAPVIFLSFLLFGFFHIFSDKSKFFSIAKYSIPVIFISSISLLYHFWNIQRNQVLLIVHSQQNINYLPSVIYVILGYGFLLLLAILGAYMIIVKKNFSEKKLFILSWASAVFLLILFKTDFQAKFIQAWVIPLSFLATYYLFLYSAFFKKWIKALTLKRTLVLVFVYVSIFFFSNIINISRNYFFIKQYPQRFYFSEDFMEAVRWSKKNIQQSDIILSSVDTGHVLAGMATRRVYLGHEGETLYKVKRQKNVEDFFSAMNNDERIRFLENENIRYVFYGPFEKLLKKDVYFDDTSFLKVYDNSKVVIYRYQLQ